MKKFNLYLIELSKNVLHEKKFKDKNPEYQDGRPCAYVGSSAKTPEERLREHLLGLKSKRGQRLWNSYAKDYGMHLLHNEFEFINPIIGTRADAESKESKLAQKLRKKGWGIWQN